MKGRKGLFSIFAVIAFFGVASSAQSPESRLELDRKGQTIVLEPYAPNILRVTLSLNREPAVAKPGYGIVAEPAAAGWTRSDTAHDDIYRSSRMVATVEREGNAGPPPLQTQVDIAKFFNGSTPGAHITFTTPEGKKLLELTDWSQAIPNHKDGTADLKNDRRSTDPEFFTVGATFVSPHPPPLGLGGHRGPGLGLAHPASRIRTLFARRLCNLAVAPRPRVPSVPRTPENP